MSTARFILFACLWLAGNIYFVASIVSMRKGHGDDAFRNVISGMLCMISAAVVMP